MQDTHKGIMDELPAQRHRATGSSPLSYRLNALGVPALLDSSKQTPLFSVRNHTFVVI